MFVSRFLPFIGLRHALRLVRGQVSHSDKKAIGQISHFQGLTNALAATMGLGNMAGVAVAIEQGGPGAIFWMWMAALLGMNTKFFECSLSLMHRGRDHKQVIQGGPMYAIENALPPMFRPLAWSFALFGLVGTTALFQTNQLSAYLSSQYDVGVWWTGLICAGAVGVILQGGLLRISQVTERLVPLMCLVYIFACCYIIALNFDALPSVFQSIFEQAFNGRAAAGGVLGAGVMEVFRVGVKRAGFSNEAGIGTAPMAHGNVKTDEPISDGFVAMLGPVMDTLIICTMTALVILTSFGGDLNIPHGAEGIVVTTMAFEKAMPLWGGPILGVAVLLFSFSTMVGMANYNEKCWNYIFKGRGLFGRPLFILWFAGTLVFGAVTQGKDVVNILDIGYGLMAFPNMLATLILASEVQKALKAYIQEHLS